MLRTPANLAPATEKKAEGIAELTTKEARHGMVSRCIALQEAKKPAMRPEVNEGAPAGNEKTWRAFLFLGEAVIRNPAGMPWFRHPLLPLSGHDFCNRAKSCSSVLC